MSLQVLILAAGKGKRMRTDLPKVLHKLAGVSLLEHVIRTAQTLHPENIYVIYGNGGPLVRSEMEHLPVKWVEQTHQLGTGHAVQQGLSHLNSQDQVLILYGDVPLISSQTLQNLLNQTRSETLSVLVAKVANPTGFGRIVRDSQGNIIAIVEQKDTTPEQAAIGEINTGIMVTSASCLQRWLPQLQSNNAQQEYYLTDIVAMAVAEDAKVNGVVVESPNEVRGINTLEELAQLERIYQHHKAQELMQAGVMLMDPHRLDIRGNVKVDNNVVIDVNVILEGKVSIGSNSRIGAHSVLRNVTVGQHVDIKENCVIEDAVLEDHCTVGPFARIRPGTHIEEHARVGNFVEIKNTRLGAHSKAPHLSYLGDATIGKQVNLGAGTITVNYDGVNKYRTVIKDGAFIGCDSQLIAPVEIGEGAYIGAGSTITTNAPANQLTLGRIKQRTIEGWKPKNK